MVLDAVLTRKNCCSKWVPTPFSCQNKDIFGPRKASENGPRYQNTGFFEKMVKWVAYDTIGRMTNFSNTGEGRGLLILAIHRNTGKLHPF